MAHFLVASRAVVANQANMSIMHLFVSFKLVTIACFLEDVLTLCQKDPSVKKYEQVSFLLDLPKEEDIFGQNTDKSFS